MLDSLKVMLSAAAWLTLAAFGADLPSTTVAQTLDEIKQRINPEVDAAGNCYGFQFHGREIPFHQSMQSGAF